MSINGLGTVLENYERQLREIGVPENEISELRARAIADCAMKLPTAHIPDVRGMLLLGSIGVLLIGAVVISAILRQGA